MLKAAAIFDKISCDRFALANLIKFFFFLIGKGKGKHTPFWAIKMVNLLQPRPCLPLKFRHKLNISTLSYILNLLFWLYHFQELLKLRKKITSTVQVLTHVKEKLQFVQAENQVQKGNLKDVEATVAQVGLEPCTVHFCNCLFALNSTHLLAR